MTSGKVSFKVGPIDLRSTPIRTFVSKSVLQLLSWIIPDVPIGCINMSVITRDKAALAMLEKDTLRWTGGCKVNNQLACTSLTYTILGNAPACICILPG